MPVLLISTYNADNTVDVMNMAWGGVCGSNMVALNIDEDHKTSQNIKERMAFTLSVADIPHIEAADFFGIASGNKMADKFERTGLHAVKSTRVDAPVFAHTPTVPFFPAELHTPAISYHSPRNEPPHSTLTPVSALCTFAPTSARAPALTTALQLARPEHASTLQSKAPRSPHTFTPNKPFSIPLSLKRFELLNINTTHNNTPKRKRRVTNQISHVRIEHQRTRTVQRNLLHCEVLARTEITRNLAHHRLPTAALSLSSQVLNKSLQHTLKTNNSLKMLHLHHQLRSSEIIVVKMLHLHHQLRSSEIIVVQNIWRSQRLPTTPTLRLLVQIIKINGLRHGSGFKYKYG